MKGSSFSATVCDSLYLLDMEGEIEEIVSEEFQISDQVNKIFLKHQQFPYSNEG